MTGVNAYAFLHHPHEFSARSGMYPLVEALAATPVFYESTWRSVQKKSWQAGQWLRELGNRYYGSAWNDLVPWLGERQLARALKSSRPCVAHFLWAEFAGPRHPELFRRRGARLIGTFHASARRLPVVLERYRQLSAWDGITLMSRTQLPFFLEGGVAEAKLRVILHGVDTRHFYPAPRNGDAQGEALRGILIGSTERDHEFMAAVLKKLPDGILDLAVSTAREQKVHYQGVRHSRMIPFLSDPELIHLYQQADLLLMPMLDCTANNAILESMACGTPVLTNRIGGIPEYVDPESSIVMERKNVDEWVDVLLDLARHPEKLRSRRPVVRRWAECFDWNLMAEPYRVLYREVLDH